MVFLSRDEVRELDRRAVEEFGVPGVVLMENAGRGVAELLLAKGVRGPVAVCCGGGNNGGDGFVLARHLDNRGVLVRVIQFAPPDALKGDAAINYAILTRTDVPCEVHADFAHPGAWEDVFPPADWIIDALLGTGLTGPPRPPFGAAIQAINRSRAKVLAVDLPSGLDCDTGEPLGETIRAHVTATFVARKKGFANPRAGEFLGAVHVLDIGAPRKLTELIVRM